MPPPAKKHHNANSMARRTATALFVLACAAQVARAWIPEARCARNPTWLFSERKFAQPNMQNKQRRKRNNNQGDDGPKLVRGDNKIIEENINRVRNAGRIGTKRYVDPCKVFVGNLPYSVDADELKGFILKIMGLSPVLLQSTKIIRDWKTNKSKGYGFCIFADPIYATVCMDVCKGKMLGGRIVSVSQGKKKEQDNSIYLKKKKKQANVDDEEAAINKGLDMAEDEAEDGIPVFGSSSEDSDLDEALFGTGLLDDEDEDEYDGIFLERPPIYDTSEIDPNLNREQRREAQKRLNRRKMPHKGFG